MRTSEIAILLLAGSMAASAQSGYEPFTGGFEIGLGYGTVIDFNLENNNLYREYLLEKLIWLPFQVSLFSVKYLDQNRYLEFGVSFARKSSSHVRRQSHLDGSFGSGLPVLELYCIDLPVKYYSRARLDGNIYLFGGIVPSWLMAPVQASNEYMIPKECYRNFLVSVFGGCSLRPD